MKNQLLIILSVLLMTGGICSAQSQTEVIYKLALLLFKD